MKDPIATAREKVGEVRSKQAGEEERFGRLLSGAVREMHDHAKREREEGDSKRHEDMVSHLKELGEHIKGLGDHVKESVEAHRNAARSHQEAADALRQYSDSHRELVKHLKAHTEALDRSRDGEIEVTKRGTVQTPSGEHHMNVVEIHRRKLKR